MPTIRVLLVDDHAVSIKGLKSLFAGETDVEFVADAADWWTAVKVANERVLDICIMDVSRPGFDGALATRRLKQVNPKIRVIALAEDNDLHRLERLLSSGINAYILKRKAATEIVPAVRAVMAVGFYLGENRRSPRESITSVPPLEDGAITESRV